MNSTFPAPYLDIMSKTPNVKQYAELNAWTPTHGKVDKRQEVRNETDQVK
jgi:hypothetical protein